MSGRQHTRPWYRNTPLVVGLVLMALGAGNWVTGEVRLSQERVVALGEPSTASAPRSEAERELARVRMDFYHVVASGGRLLAAAGFLVAAIGFARHLRPAARGA